MAPTHPTKWRTSLVCRVNPLINKIRRGYSRSPKNRHRVRGTKFLKDGAYQPFASDRTKAATVQAFSSAFRRLECESLSVASASHWDALRRWRILLRSSFPSRQLPRCQSELLHNICKGARSDPRLLRIGLVRNKSPQVVQSGERTNPEGKPVSNKILLSTSEADYGDIRPHLEYVSLPNHLVLHEAGGKLEFAYFPNRGFDFSRGGDERRKNCRGWNRWQ